MKINVKVLLFLTVFICSCCTGNAYASNVVALDLSFNPASPFWPGEEVAITASVYPSQSGAYVQIQSEFGGYFASGYTDSNGEFTGVYTIPDDALERVQYASQIGSIGFTAICPESEDQGWAQSLDYYCNIVPEEPEPSNVVAMDLSFNPAPPFFPGEQVTVTVTVSTTDTVKSGIHVQLFSEHGGQYADGYTDSDGKFTGTYTVPADSLEWAENSSQGGITMSAYCPDQGVQSDTVCKIVSLAKVTSLSTPYLLFDPQPPFWPNEKVNVTATVKGGYAGTVFPLPGAHVIFVCEGSRGFFAEGDTDRNGKVTVVYTWPSDAYERSIRASYPGSLVMGAVVTYNELGLNTRDYQCAIIPYPPVVTGVS